MYCSIVTEQNEQNPSSGGVDTPDLSSQFSGTPYYYMLYRLYNHSWVSSYCNTWNVTSFIVLLANYIVT